MQTRTSPFRSSPTKGVSVRRLLAPLVAIAVLIPLAPFAARAAAQTYYVGAATRRIDPDAPGSPLAPGTAVQKGGFNLGNGTVIPPQVIKGGDAARDEG